MAFDVQGYLESLNRFGLKPGLDRIRALLERLSHPEEAFPAIHVGGTNGKGSIASVTTSILRQAGYRVGLFTSPHLSRYHERIQVDGRPIPDADLQSVFEEVAAAAEPVRARYTDPTEFEVGTAAALLYFKQRRVDVAVVEVGLGGRLDSTNVVHAKGVAIGPISFDHTAILGSDLASIAREKAGIFRPDVPAVIAPQPPEAAEVFAEVGRSLPSPVIWVQERARPGLATGETPCGTGHRGPGATACYEVIQWDASGGRFHLETPRRRFRELHTPLLGYHQVQNAAVAVTLADALAGTGFRIHEDHIREGLRLARWPGRLELIPGTPQVLLDGVHNEGGAEAFARSFGRLFPGVHPVFVVALTGGKDPAKVFGPIAPFASYMVTTRPDSSRIPVAEPEELAQSIRALGVPAEAQETADKALERARKLALELAGDEAMVCICGSLYLVGDLRGRLVADV